MPRMALAIAGVVGAFGLAAPVAPGAVVTSVLSGQTVSGQPIPCVVAAAGVRVCHGDDGGLSGPDLRLKSFDGVPLELYVILPPASSGHSDGNYPLIVQSHGWGGSATGLANSIAYVGPGAGQWATKGYAVLQLTARGFGDSCGAAARAAETAAHYTAVCSKGYIRLDDERYEARDVQYAIGLLADAGIVNPRAIGVTGPSYGGGVSLELATLKDRVMNANGTLSPWRSPGGKPLRITAAAPVIPWSDLVYSLEPNGRTLDYRLTGAGDDLSPTGVEKQSFEGGLFTLGKATGSYSAPGTDPQADIVNWYATVNAGEPYGREAAFASAQIAQYHSPYYLLDGKYRTALESPSPLLIANGFTDDLFPVDEALRYYNLERALYPSDPLKLVDGDFGHMRAQNKPGDVALLSGRIERFFDYFLKHAGAAPRSGVTATIETVGPEASGKCPSTPLSGGPFSASSWAGLHPGEVRFVSTAFQTVTSGAGSPSISQQIDPIAGPGACAAVSGTDQGAGVATYRLPASRGRGYTLLGSPTVVARLVPSGSFPELAERLWDVDPATNTETLVARGLYRPTASGLQVFQLHPGAWHFAAGHIPKLELLAQDSPYGRTSNGRFSIAVSGLQLRLPVHEAPGSSAAVRAPQSPVVLGCAGLPSARIQLVVIPTEVIGAASETPCPAAGRTISSRQHVVKVYVIIERRAGNGPPRVVARLPARGTRHWTVQIPSRLVPFDLHRYLLTTDAVDALGQHQPPGKPRPW